MHRITAAFGTVSANTSRAILGPPINRRVIASLVSPEHIFPPSFTPAPPFSITVTRTNSSSEEERTSRTVSRSRSRNVVPAGGGIKCRGEREEKERREKRGESWANGQSFEMVNDSQGPLRRAVAVPDDEVNARNCTESESCGRSASN